MNLNEKIKEIEEIAKTDDNSVLIETTGKLKCKTLIDKKFYDDIVGKFSLNINKNYVNVYDSKNNKIRVLHRFIYYELEKNELNKDKPFIDHINNNPIDNRLSNLRDVTYEENSHNRSKNKNTTSKYYGVKYNKSRNYWNGRLHYKGKNYNFSYKLEEHCAYHYDLLVKELKLEEFKNLNNIEKPNNFIKQEKLKKSNLPSNIYKKDNKYYFSLNKKTRVFLNLEDAIIYKNRIFLIKELDNINKKKLEKNEINCDENNRCYINIYDKNKNLKAKTFVDKDKYEDLIKYKWNFNNGYVCANLKNKKTRMHRYLMNCNDPNLFVDHIDGNPLNNQISNLRIVTKLQNSQNKLSKPNSSSKYTGVSIQHDKKWRYRIRFNNKSIEVCSFPTELEAALAREEKVKELNKNNNCCFKLNFPEKSS